MIKIGLHNQIKDYSIFNIYNSIYKKNIKIAKHWKIIFFSYIISLLKVPEYAKEFTIF